MTAPKKDAPAFDFYPERWLAATAKFSDAEQLSYLRLLCHQWLMEELPDDTATLKRLAGKGVTPALLEKFPLTVTGMRQNRRLEIIRQEQRERISNRSEQRRAAAMRRWHGPHAEVMREPCDGNADANADALRAQCPPPTTHHSPSVLLEKEPKAAPSAAAPVRPRAGRVWKDQTADEANEVPIPLSLRGMPGFSAFHAAWLDWCAYRTERATVGPVRERVPWTCRAARNGLMEIERVAAGIGLDPITQRIRQAIGGSWQGLNLDRMKSQTVLPSVVKNSFQPPRQHETI